MGLTRIPESNKGEISTFQLLLEIATSLAKLTDNPKALEKAAEEAYKVALSSEERATNANANIAKAESAIAAAAVKQKEVDAVYADAQDKLSIANAQLEKAAKESARLETLSINLKQKSAEILANEVALAAREAAVVSANTKLASDLAALEDRWKEVKTGEKALQEKVEKLRNIAGA